MPLTSFKIVPPWGRYMFRTWVKNQVVTQNNTNVGATTIKLYIGASVEPHKVQSCVGTIRLLRNAIISGWGQKDNAVDWIVRGHYINAARETVIIDEDNLSIAVTDIAIIVGRNFVSANGGRNRATHFIDETITQLTEVFLESAKFN